jgi:hypothetical protein
MASKPTPKLPPPEEYGRFVAGLDLQRVRLIESTIRASEPMSPDPSNNEVKLEETYSAISTEDGFEAMGIFRVQVKKRETNIEQGIIEVKFGFLYFSDMKLDVDDFPGYFEIFKQLVLPINVWPFAREYIQNSIVRMGWAPFTLPLRKVGDAHRKTI